MSEEWQPKNPDRDPFRSWQDSDRPNRTSSVRFDDTSHQSERPAVGPALAPTPAELPQLGPFQLISQVGEGGVGTVYRAFDTKLGRVVALKVLRSGALATETEVKRFNNEAQLAAGLDHPSIVSVFENGENQGIHYLAMALVEGIGLDELIKQGPVPGKEAAKLIHSLASAVDYAHEKGVIHRDLKPANILLVESQQNADPSLFQPHRQQAEVEHGSQIEKSAVEGDVRVATYFPKIVDFGIAQHNDSASGLTTTGSILGTPSYMSPEQASLDEDVAEPSDVYALGTILYEMICGRPPFQAATPMETIQQVISEPPAPPRRLNPTIDRNLEIICLKCLWKQPTRRYGSAGELVEDLERYLQDRPVKARPVGLVERSKMWCHRNPSLAVATLASLAMITAVFVLFVVFKQLQFSRAQTAAEQFKAESFKETADLRESLLYKERLKSANQEYFARYLAVRERAGSSELGWTRKSLADIDEANSFPIAIKDPLQLRSEALRCLTSPDLIESWAASVSLLHRSHLASYSGDGSLVAFATLKNRVALKVRVLDTRTGTTVHQLQVASSLSWQIQSGGEVDGIRNLAFSDNGKRLYARTRSGWLHEWNLENANAPIWSTRFPLNSIDAVVFDPVKPRAFLLQDGKLHEWPDFTSKKTRILADCDSDHIAISDSGQVLVARDGGVVRVVDLTETRERQDAIRVPGGMLSLSQDGKFLASTSNNAVSIYRTSSGARISRLHHQGDTSLHQARITSVAFSKCKTLVLTGANDRSIKLWDTVSGRFCGRQFIGGTDDICVKFSPSGNQAVVAGNSRLTAYEVNGLEVQSSTAIQENVISSMQTAVDSTLFTAALSDHSDAYRVGKWNLAGDLLGQLTSSIGTTQRLDLAVASGATRIAITSRDASVVHFLDVKSDEIKLASKQELHKPSQPIFLRRDANTFACILDNSKVRMWAVVPWKANHQWAEGIGQIQGGPALKCLAANRHWVLAAKQFGRIEILNNELKSSGTVAGNVEPCSLALEGDLGICGLADGTIRLFSLSKPSELQVLKGHTGEVNCSLFLTINTTRFAITGSGDGLIRIWRVTEESSGAKELRPYAHWQSARPCEQLEFSDQSLFLRLQAEKAIRRIQLGVLLGKLQNLDLK